MSNGQVIAFLSHGLLGGGLPALNPFDVREGTPIGDGRFGTLSSPSTGDVRYGTRYGGDGIQYIGTMFPGDVPAPTTFDSRIRYSYPRIGSMIQRAIMEKIQQPQHDVTFRKIMSEFQSNHPDRIYMQGGRSKVNSDFPNVGIEIQTRRDSWAATNYTKELEYTFKVYVALKALMGPSVDEKGEQNPVEDYIVALSEFITEILNEPFAALQYDISDDGRATRITPPLRIYDSLVSTVAYGHLYNGALRIAELSWTGKILRIGPTGGGLMGYDS